MTLDDLARLYKEAGCRNLYAKVLAKNDNSKQQIYFGPGFSALSLFPNRGVRPEEKPGNLTFKVPVSFSWIGLDGRLTSAPGAQLSPRREIFVAAASVLSGPVSVSLSAVLAVPGTQLVVWPSRLRTALSCVSRLQQSGPLRWLVFYEGQRRVNLLFVFLKLKMFGQK